MFQSWSRKELHAYNLIGLPILLTNQAMEFEVMKKAMLVIKRRCSPMLAAIVDYNESSGRQGRILVSEPIKSDFSNADLTVVARRLVPQVMDREVILPTGVDL